MRFAILMIAFLASPAAAAEIAPPTIVKDASSYAVTLHVTTVMEAAKQVEALQDDAVTALGSVSGVQSGAMPRPDGSGYDVTYKFIPGTTTR